MSAPRPTVAAAAERDAEAAEIYAPPGDDRLVAPPEASPAPAARNPALVGFLTLLVTSLLSSAAAGGLMRLWYELTPIGKGFLAGLGEVMFAIFGWLALSAFSVLAGIALAAGVLGREGKVSNAGKAVTAVLAVLAAGVCFIPVPETTFALRGLFGLTAEGLSLLLTFGALTLARRRFLGPPGG